MFSLGLIFGLTNSSIGVRVNYALGVTIKVVTNIDESSFWTTWPNRPEMEISSGPVEAKEIENDRLIKEMFSVTDGGRMPWANFTDVNV